MPKGQVKWFDPKKGYGFIVGPEGQDVFVHYSHIESEGFRALKDGEWVEYELIQGDKGWQARGVKQAAAEGGSTGQAPSAPPPAPAARSRGYENPNIVVDRDQPTDTAPKLGGGYEGAE